MKISRIAAAIIAGTVFTSLFAAPTAGAADFTAELADVADTFTNQSLPNENYGSSSSLGVYGSPARTAALRFVLPATPSGQVLNSASLTLHTTSIPSAGSVNPSHVRLASDSWSEADTNYSNRPLASGPVLGSLPGGSVPNAAQKVSLTISDFAGRTGPVTLAVEGTGTDSLWIWSREHNIPSLRPTLTLSYTDAGTGPGDTTPPSRPTSLTATVNQGSIDLAWVASTDDTAVTGYTVHRASTAGFTASPATRIAQTTGLAFTDPSRPAGTWYYQVTASDAAGNTSAPSGEVPATITATPPNPTTTVSAVASADTFTNMSAPSTNYGTSTSMGIYGSPARTALLRFEIPAIPTGQTLTGATLTISTTNITSSGTADALTVRSVGDNWDETTTYTNRPTATGPSRGTLPGGSIPNTSYPIKLAPVTFAGPGPATLALEGTGADSLWIWSREHSVPSLRPSLSFTYTDTGPGPDPSELSVIAVGDIACAPSSPVTQNSCRHADVAALVNEADPARFIALGDLQYAQATLAEFLGAGAYNDTFGPLRQRTLPVLGNHEYYSGTSGYFDYFYGAGVNQGPYGARPDGYYSTNVGTWTFIALNSECGSRGVTGGCAVGSPQYNWLESILNNAPTQCTIVATHRPRWSTGASHGSYPELSALWDLMARKGVDMALAGHNRISEIFKPIGVSGTSTTPRLQTDGIRAFTAGGGGAHLQELSASNHPLDDMSSSSWAGASVQVNVGYQP